MDIGHPTADRIHALADTATAFGAPIGIILVLIGLLTLRSGARTARLQHMHELFKEYLRMQFDYNVAAGKSNERRDELRSNLGGFKMYSLEEMTLWLKRERGWLKSPPWAQDHRRYAGSWQSTIEWHLDDSSFEDIDEARAAWNCYGEEFQREIEKSLLRVPLDQRHSRVNAPAR